jgi:phage terminase Nu1 subunit (DNA packaging protein)
VQPSEDRLIDERAVSEITGIKIRTLRKWRLQGRGPAVRRIEGRLIRYSLREAHEWMRAQPHLAFEDPSQEKLAADGREA